MHKAQLACDYVSPDLLMWPIFGMFVSTATEGNKIKMAFIEIAKMKYRVRRHSERGKDLVDDVEARCPSSQSSFPPAGSL
jgi:hypothetical protein